MRFVACLAIAALLGVPGAAGAADATGIWLRDTGEAKVRVAPCGDALCGHIVWLRDHNGNGKIGERVFYDMKPSGDNTWSGSAFNPDDGQTYAGKMTLAGNQLTTAGCVLGGLICKTVNWTRSQ
jgi:uncharacterized protein (DUF2147 family)